jgi:hypothetical protein
MGQRASRGNALDVSPMKLVFGRVLKHFHEEEFRCRS